MLNVIAGYDPNDATSSREPVPDYTSRLGGDLKGMRVGVIRELNTGISEPVARAFDASLKQLQRAGRDRRRGLDPIACRRLAGRRWWS